MLSYKQQDYTSTYCHSSNPQTEPILWFLEALLVQSLEEVKETQLKAKQTNNTNAFLVNINYIQQFFIFFFLLKDFWLQLNLNNFEMANVGCKYWASTVLISMCTKEKQLQNETRQAVSSGKQKNICVLIIASSINLTKGLRQADYLSKCLKSASSLQIHRQ